MLNFENAVKNSKYRGHFSSHQEYFDVGFFFFLLLINNSCLIFWRPSLVQFVIITKMYIHAQNCAPYR